MNSADIADVFGVSTNQSSRILNHNLEITLATIAYRKNANAYPSGSGSKLVLPKSDATQHPTQIGLPVGKT